MDKSISDFRLNILVKEYRRHFSQAREKSFIPAFWMGVRNVVSPFELFGSRRKVLWGQKFYKILACAVLCKYVSVKLNAKISEEINDLIRSRESSNWLSESHPEIFLLVLLHVKGDEVQTNDNNHESVFEDFLILDWGFKDNREIRLFLKYLRSTKDTDRIRAGFLQLVASLSKSTGNEAGHTEEEGAAFFDVILGFIALNDFMSRFSEFLVELDSSLLAKSFYAVYQDTFTFLENKSLLMHTFYEHMPLLIESEKWNSFNPILLNGLTDEEVIEWKSDCMNEIAKAKEYNRWLIERKNTEDLKNYIRTDDRDMILDMASG